MSNHDDDETGGAIIILSVALPAKYTLMLDDLAAAGGVGSTREDVARHLICGQLGVSPNLPE